MYTPADHDRLDLEQPFGSRPLVQVVGQKHRKAV